MKTEGLKINILGDSITYGSGASKEENIYHRVLKRELNLAEVRSYGIGGTRYALQKGTAKRPKDDYADVNSFAERFDKMSDDADVVLVFGGTNDFGHGDAPIGTPSDRTPDTFYGACHYVFSGLIKKYLGKPIIVMTPLHRINENSVYGEFDAKETPSLPLVGYVNIIREVAEYYSLPVLDLFKCSMIQPEIKEVRERYTVDGLHPSDEGHKLLSDMIKKFLSAF